MEQTANPISRAVGPPIDSCATIVVVGTSRLAVEIATWMVQCWIRVLISFLSPAVCIVVPKTTKVSQQQEFYGPFKINVQRSGL